MTFPSTPAIRSGFRFRPERDQLLAEAHARPATLLPSSTLATRIAALSGTDGPDGDWKHMVALCRKLGVPEPHEGARWCAVDAGSWRLRWERHTELSTWTFYHPIADDTLPAMGQSALDFVPQDWLGEIPGEILVAAHASLLRITPPHGLFAIEDEIAVSVADGTARLFTDFRAGPDGFTRFIIVQPAADARLAGRIVQQVFEIETYRLMALLAFPLANEATASLGGLEARAQAAALQLSEAGGIEADRVLLNRLAELAGQAQSLNGHTGFRFAAARAYYGIVQERIRQLRETRLEGRPMVSEFMERRLAPAMRTCAAVAERQEHLIEHISRTSQLLNTRVDVAAEVTNANLLASMDRRATMQLRLQQTVEGLSVAAISYYAIGLLAYVFKALSEVLGKFDPAIVTGLAAPPVIAIVWFSLHRTRARLLQDHSGRDRRTPHLP